MLITNSDYHYTNKMMSFAYNRFMPHGSTWRDLFDMVCSLSLDHKQRSVFFISSSLCTDAPEAEALNKDHGSTSCAQCSIPCCCVGAPCDTPYF